MMKDIKLSGSVLITAGLMVFGGLANSSPGEEKGDGKQGDAPRTFADSNNECYRAVGRGMYDKAADRTYQVYLNDHYRPWIIAYDHGKGEWSEPVMISSESYGEDDHFYPSLWINSRGYIHVVWGAHGDPYKHLASKQPHKITSWEKKAKIGNGCYAQPIATSGGKEVYLFMTQYNPRRLVYYKSEDGGDTFGSRRLVIGPGYNGKARGIYVGNIKHQPATDSEPEKFHIPWVFFHSNNKFNIGGRQYPVHYAWFNADNGHVYNAAGKDLGEHVKYPEGWEACLVAMPRYEEKFMQYINNAWITKAGNPFVIWQEKNTLDPLQDDDAKMFTYFSVYDPGKEEWVTRQIYEEEDPCTRCTDVNVTDDGTIELLKPSGNTMDILRSEDNGKTWERETVYRASRDHYMTSDMELIYFGAFIDSAHMGSDAARHPDYKLTFKQFFRGQRKNLGQYAWGESGFLEP